MIAIIAIGFRDKDTLKRPRYRLAKVHHELGGSVNYFLSLLIADKPLRTSRALEIPSLSGIRRSGEIPT